MTIKLVRKLKKLMDKFKFISEVSKTLTQNHILRDN